MLNFPIRGLHVSDIDTDFIQIWRENSTRAAVAETEIHDESCIGGKFMARSVRLALARKLTIAFSSGRNIICMLREKALSCGKNVVTSLVIVVFR